MPVLSKIQVLYCLGSGNREGDLTVSVNMPADLYIAKASISREVSHLISILFVHLLFMSW